MPEFERRQIRTQSSHLVSPAKPDRAMPRPAHTQNPLLTHQQAVGNQAMQRFAQSCPLRLPSPSLCPFGGVCHTCPARVQAKLTINEPGDKYEQEADQVAEQVMRMPDPATMERTAVAEQAQGSRFQRGCSECDEELRRQPEEEEEEEEILQAKPSHGVTPELAPDEQTRINAMRGAGQPLSESVRSFFEPRFGYDFSQVRVYTDERAVDIAQSLNAKALTVGQNVIFGAGQYSPETTAGEMVLAHELTHVVQQGQAPPARPTMIHSHENRHEPRTPRVRHRRDTELVGQSRLIGPGSRNAHRWAYVQRLVRRTRVTCPAPGGGIRNPYSADRRASKLLDGAIKRINSAVANRAANPAHADVVAVGKALRRAFRLNPARNSTWTQGAPRVRLPVIRRRLEIAKNYIDSVVFRFNCVATGGSHTIPGCAAGTCTAGTEAFSCPSNPTDMVLCPLFWTRSLNQRGRIMAHEVFHINFGFIHDWGQPDVHNAHCYAQFVALLNGFNSPAGFRCH